MIFRLTTFTLIHVVLSLVGIIAGLVVAGGLVGGKRLDRWAVVFLITTIATSATGFGFPFVAFLPSHAVGIVSLVVLPIVIVAHYVKHFAGAWRRTYVVGVVFATYLNVFVLVVQLKDVEIGGEDDADHRSEEHTSELQSQSNLVCRLLLEKKKNKYK